MLYVLEGCDGAGKSTFANQLRKITGAEIIHCTATTPNDEAFFRNIVNVAKVKDVIADRFCYGQFVYQAEEDRPLGKYQDSIKTLGYLEAEMLKAGVKVILVTAPEEVIEERLALRNEVLINGLTVKKIQARFQAIRKMSCLEWIEIDTGGEE